MYYVVLMVILLKYKCMCYNSTLKPHYCQLVLSRLPQITFGQMDPAVLPPFSDNSAAQNIRTQIYAGFICSYFARHYLLIEALWTTIKLMQSPKSE